ncbi:MAG TPA: hypothetical protein VFJ58_10975 [Armatimonadota bacterium]|nr:hypothetical protein [Armatimonadota bacterium]
MNRQELLDALRREHIRDDAYDLTGGHLSERYTFGEVRGRWYVYYSERGQETGRREFATEAGACEYFLNMLKADPTTRDRLP